jgi:hypothetical protein
MDRNDITRISELPDMGGGFSSGARGGQQYQPLNIHQNPYGIPEPTDTKLPTIQVRNDTQMGGGSGGFGGDMMQRAPPAMMNRGIPNDTESYQNDEHMIPNHIPTAKLTTDYLREYEDRMAKMTEVHQKEKYRTDLISSLYDELQTPILIGVLFFLFQIPFINVFMFKYLSFMKIYNDDGNLNLYGLIFKSCLFGLIYFWFVRITTYI